MILIDWYENFCFISFINCLIFILFFVFRQRSKNIRIWWKQLMLDQSKKWLKQKPGKRWGYALYMKNFAIIRFLIYCYFRALWFCMFKSVCVCHIYIYNKHSFHHLWQDYLYIYQLIVGWVFTNGPRYRGSIPGRVIPKTLKMVLDATLLNTQHYKVRIKGKVEQSREWSSALPYTSVY